ncbi:hypothetical protein MA16_Dca002249 [Dendrobium catenatum]|uniref:Uncharacterized protein n=1 Tax=Dendrobium catenatum TaxID=906689 RepID=A0A2I0VZY7_9ASPA|nr:hypothetical protein MA16_Dca002249 [Dendrobium catenatum]
MPSPNATTSIIPPQIPSNLPNRTTPAIPPSLPSQPPINDIPLIKDSIPNLNSPNEDLSSFSLPSSPSRNHIVNVITSASSAKAPSFIKGLSLLSETPLQSPNKFVALLQEEPPDDTISTDASSEQSSAPMLQNAKASKGVKKTRPSNSKAR